MILLASMSAAPAEPQGILFNRPGASCSGGGLVANVRVRVRERPRPILGLLARTRDRFGASASCSGGYAFSASVNVAGGLPMPAAEAPSRAVPPGEVAATGLLSRLAVRHHLREALSQTHEMSTLNVKQKGLASRAATDRRVFNALVDQVHRDLGNQMGATAFADWFKVIMDNLPAIIDMIERIIKLFGAHYWFTLDNYASVSPQNGQELFGREFMLAA